MGRGMIEGRTRWAKADSPGHPHCTQLGRGNCQEFKWKGQENQVLCLRKEATQRTDGAQSLGGPAWSFPFLSRTPEITHLLGKGDLTAENSWTLEDSGLPRTGGFPKCSGDYRLNCFHYCYIIIGISPLPVISFWYLVDWKCSACDFFI